MTIRHRVRQGECIASIAQRHGHFPDSIWNDPDNADLKALREDPDVLMPGDIVVVRDKRRRTLEAASGTRHRFTRKGVPKNLRVRCLVFGEPRANETCRVVIDGALEERRTDGDGWLDLPISLDARIMVIHFEDGEVCELDLGHMDPVTEVSGAQARLRNLGFFLGEIDGNPSALLEEAIRAFQTSAGVEATGSLDEDTERELTDAAGC